MWQVMTHLNPKTNNLEQFTKDLLSLINGKSIQQRHYDHSKGKFSKPRLIQSNDHIVVRGLHALYLPILRTCYDLSIYLDIYEELRRYFKVKRDVYQRGHTMDKVLLSLEKREKDSLRFIQPQAEYADLILSLQPVNPHLLQNIENNKNKTLPLKFIVFTWHGINELPLVRMLIGICGLHVDLEMYGNRSEIEMKIEGEASAEDIAFAAHKLMPDLIEILDLKPSWQDGIQGIMQLIVLSHVHQTLQKRLV